MSVYDRSSATDFQIIDRWSDGVGWIAHPNEDGMRASHAVKADDGVWVIDPIDAPGIDDLLQTLGSVTGVAVLSSYHARDAGVVANRHNVAVHIPERMDRLAERTDAPIERYEKSFGDSGFQIYELNPLSMWQEAIAYREDDGTLIIPDLLGTGSGYTVGDEQIGVILSHRLFPPRDTLFGLEPERVLFGHGEGVFEDADKALNDALSNARKQFPHAFIRHFWTNVRLLAAAMKE